MRQRNASQLDRAITIRQRFCLLTLLLWALCTPPSVRAHGLNASYATITVTQKQLQVVFSFSFSDMAVHFHLDTNNDGRVSQDELRAAAPILYDFIASRATLRGNSTPITLQREQVTVTQDASSQEFVNLMFHAPTPVGVSEVSITLDLGLFETFGQTYTNLVKVVAGDETQQTVLSLEHLSQRFSVSQHTALFTQLVQFTRLGIRHIFLGYDHIMFLLALIVIGGRLLNLVKIVTAFTLAHSLTLILAALQVVSLPSRVTESAIALSIAYVAAENVLIAEPTHRWRLTFCFGLVHGFGFANVLRELGLPTRGLVSSLLAFNVGVELGQLGILAILFPLALWVAKQPFRRPVIVGLSSTILLFGIGWFIERAFAFSFMPF